MNTFQLTIWYAGPPCPCRGCVPGRDCMITYDDVPATHVHALQWHLRFPRWMRRHLRYQITDRLSDETVEYDVSRITRLRIQPQQEVIS